MHDDMIGRSWLGLYETQTLLRTGTARRYFEYDIPHLIVVYRLPASNSRTHWLCSFALLLADPENRWPGGLWCHPNGHGTISWSTDSLRFTIDDMSQVLNESQSSFFEILVPNSISQEKRGLLWMKLDRRFPIQPCLSD